jgi:hypothetical protein
MPSVLKAAANGGPIQAVNDPSSGPSEPYRRAAGQLRRVVRAILVPRRRDANSQRCHHRSDAPEIGYHCSQKNPRLGTSFEAASMISSAVLSVSAASAALACSVG